MRANKNSHLLYFTLGEGQPSHQMHSMGIHSALAIKRQRKRRDEAKKSRERRYSIQSSESGDTLHSPRSSIRRKIRHNQHHQPTFQDTKVVTSIGMLHIGVVFLVFGVFLVGAGLIPDDATATTAWSIFGKHYFEFVDVFHCTSFNDCFQN